MQEKYGGERIIPINQINFRNCNLRDEEILGRFVRERFRKKASPGVNKNMLSKIVTTRRKQSLFFPSKVGRSEVESVNKQGLLRDFCDFTQPRAGLKRSSAKDFLNANSSTYELLQLMDRESVPGLAENHEESLMKLVEECRRKGFLESGNSLVANFDPEAFEPLVESAVQSRRVFQVEKRFKSHLSVMELGDHPVPPKAVQLQRATSTHSNSSLQRRLKSLWIILIDSLLTGKPLDQRKVIGYHHARPNRGLFEGTQSDDNFVEIMLARIRKDLETEVVYGFLGMPFIMHD